jgi:acyl-CoA thioester hydrolase
MDNKHFKHRIPIQVRFNDIDMLGHVSNTVYPDYFDLGKLAYFDEVIPEMKMLELGFVGASVKLDFFKPVFLRTRIAVETRTQAIGNKSLTLEQRIIDLDSGDICTFCTTVLVCFSIQNQSSLPLPESWRSKFEAFENK